MTEEDMLFKAQSYGGFVSPLRIKPEFNDKQGLEFSKVKRGVAICIISRGSVPINWMMHINEAHHHFPIGLFWKFIVVERQSWAAARTECVRKARESNFKWLFFIDDDVFIPFDALAKLLGSGKEIISGVYWTKSENTAPVIFEDIGQGPMYNFPVDEVIAIGGAGLGCVLINMEVFDKFDEAGMPYFVENWTYTAPDGNRIKCNVGEDHYFYLKAREFGYQPYAHTGVLCDHYDVGANKFYPNEAIVKKFCAEKITTQDKVELDRLRINPDKKTIFFYNHSVAFAGDELVRRGVGGSESDIIYLAREFVRTNKYNVKVYCTCPRPGTYENVEYRDAMNIQDDLLQFGGCDLLISSRNLDLAVDPNFKSTHNVKNHVLWAHDLATDEHWWGIGGIYQFFDAIVTLSRFHKANIKSAYGSIPDEMFKIIGDAVDSELYKIPIGKIEGRCIYTSTPYRGLSVLLNIWPRIKERVPHATLALFSSIKTYAENFDDSPWDELYMKAKNMPGVLYHGSVPKQRLAEEQKKSELLLYPNIFQETYCISAIEAQMAGCPVITTMDGALPETIAPGCGVIIDGNPLSKEYQDQFVEAAIELLTDRSKLNQMKAECLKQDFSWKNRVKEWEKLFLN